MALMAYLRDGDVDELLRKYPLVKRASGSITDPEEFKRRLKEVREKGYAYGESEVEEGRIAVAAPVRDHVGKVVASVGVSAPSSSGREAEQKTELIRAVVDAATKISEALGFGH